MANAEFIVGNCHLFWNPAKPEIKLAQVRLFRQKLTQFLNEFCKESTPIVAVGDFNSLPGSEVILEMKGCLGRTYDLNSSYLRGRGTKFLCDANLNRLCRWMRVLGIDTALESAESAEKRTGKARPADLFFSLFQRARAERRVIITGSKRMQQLAGSALSTTVLLLYSL